MLVKNLIKYLRSFDQNAEVLISSDSKGTDIFELDNGTETVFDQKTAVILWPRSIEVEINTNE